MGVVYAASDPQGAMEGADATTLVDTLLRRDWIPGDQGVAGVRTTALIRQGGPERAAADALVAGSMTAANVDMSAPVQCALAGESIAALTVGRNEAPEIAAEHAAHRLAETHSQLGMAGDLATLLRMIDTELREHGGQHPEFAGMASEVGGLLFLGDGAYWFTVGDVQVYRVQQGGLRRLDHGGASRPLGGDESLELLPHIALDPGPPRGTWLVVGIGVTRHVPHPDLERAVTGANGDMDAVLRLHDAAKAAGSQNDTSVLIVRRP